MTSLTYDKLELLICLHFPMAATGINKVGVWLAALLSTILALWCGRMVHWRNPLGKKKKKRREL